MRLVSAVLGFALRKAGSLLAVVLALFVGLLLVQAAVPAIKDAVTERDRLQEVAEERAALESDLTRLRADLAEAQREEVASRLESIDAEVDALGERVSAKRSEVAEKVAESEQRGRLRDIVENLPLVPTVRPQGARRRVGAGVARDPRVEPRRSRGRERRCWVTRT